MIGQLGTFNTKIENIIKMEILEVKSTVSEMKSLHALMSRIEMIKVSELKQKLYNLRNKEKKE
jgi:hypothetical protein